MLPEPRSTRSVSSRLPINARNQLPATRRTYLSPAAPPSGKKLRHRMTDEQTMKLDALYNEKTHPTTQEKRRLGQEIGLETKTVSVWFQNRRRKDKEGSLSSTSRSPSSDTLRLKAVSSPSKNATFSDCSLSPGAMSESLSPPDKDPLSRSRCGSTLGNSAEHLPDESPMISANDLWKHLLSSPGTETDDENAADTLVNVFASDDPAAFTNGKKSLVLEWACDRQAKRRRIEREDDLADESGNSTKICPQCLQPSRFNLESATLTNLPVDVIAPSHDVMHAASMLLCFKYSAQTSQSSGKF